MAKKVLQLIECCNDCPNKSYYSGGAYECAKVGTILPHNEGHRAPGWCPLTEYPSDMVRERDLTIAELQRQLEAARDPKTVSEAAEVLRLMTGHDSQPNIDRRYGQRWWEPIKKIEQDLRAMLPKDGTGGAA